MHPVQLADWVPQSHATFFQAPQHQLAQQERGQKHWLNQRGQICERLEAFDPGALRRAKVIRPSVRHG
jgi:hypothetical protein